MFEVCMQHNFKSSVVLQVELLDAAKERNIIVCLGTGSSKIFIATKLIQELANAVRRLVII
jgi:ERCC4-related helicase